MKLKKKYKISQDQHHIFMYEKCLKYHMSLIMWYDDIYPFIQQYQASVKGSIP